ncbi:MAG: hypothetical protein QM667_04565 [Asticcacaulis sp.]
MADAAQELVSAIVSISRGENTDAGLQTVLSSQVAPSTLTPAQKQAILKAVDAVLSQPSNWAENIAACLLLASAAGKYADNTYGVRQLMKAYEVVQDRRFKTELFFTINSLCFSRGVDVGFDMGDLYFDLYARWFRYFKPLSFTPQKGRCAILLSQFLMPPHAPTVDTLAKFRILRDVWGYDVVVINTNERPSKIDLPLLEKFPNNVHPQLSGFQVLNAYGVDNLKIFTPSDMPSHPGYIALMEFVEVWQPEFILNYGAYNFSAEFLAQSVKTITMPAGTELLPTRTSEYDVVFHPYGELEAAAVAHFGMQNVKVIEALYNYDMPPQSEHYDRAMFGLSDEDFVITVVGNRLDNELGPENREMLKGLAAIDPSIRLVFAGGTSDRTRAFIAEVIDPAQLRFPGFVKDMLGLYDLADLYVNPRRTGGASSAVYALGKGVPAFTLRQGHVADTTHPDFVFDDVAALTAAVTAAVQGVRGALKPKALEGFERVGSRERMLETILTGAQVEKHKG